MLNALLTQAAKDGASDIHIEPYERSSAVRFRVDGSLRDDGQRLLAEGVTSLEEVLRVSRDWGVDRRHRGRGWSRHLRQHAAACGRFWAPADGV